MRFNSRIRQNGINFAVNNLLECISQGHKKRLPMASIVWKSSLKLQNCSLSIQVYTFWSWAISRSFIPKKPWKSLFCKKRKFCGQIVLQIENELNLYLASARADKSGKYWQYSWQLALSLGPVTRRDRF